MKPNFETRANRVVWNIQPENLSYEAKCDFVEKALRKAYQDGMKAEPKKKKVKQELPACQILRNRKECGRHAEHYIHKIIGDGSWHTLVCADCMKRRKWKNGQNVISGE